jgi:hypothetical protein
MRRGGLTRNASEPQEGSADDAETQPAGGAATAVRDMFGANSKNSEPQAEGSRDYTVPSQSR